MSFETDFGTLRSLLQTPNATNWKRICGIIDRYWLRWNSPEVQEQLIPYVSAILARWPGNIRRYAQHLWLHDVMCGRDVPQIAFASALHLVGQELSQARMERLFDTMYLEKMQLIDLRGVRVGEDMFIALGSADHIQSLKVLNLHSTRITPLALELLVQSQVLQDVEQLDLSSNQLRTLDCLCGLSLPKVKRLNLSANRLTYGNTESVLQTWRLPSLEVLELNQNRISHFNKFLHSTRMPKLHTIEVAG